MGDPGLLGELLGGDASLRTKLRWISLVLIVVGPVAAVAESIVIVHPESKVSVISRSELSKIFLRRLRTWADGTDALPVDQLPSGEAREEFSQRIHGRGVVTVEVYWKRMIFSGRGVPPRELADDQAVLEFVRSNPGAVGYVSSATALEGVKRLTVTE